MDELVLLKSYYHKHDAEIAIGLLKDAGINTILQSDDLGGLRPHLTLGMGNNRVMIQKKDAEKALDVIKTLQEDLSEEELKQIEEMAVKEKESPLPKKNKKFNKDYSIIIPIVIAIVFLILYLFKEIHK